MVLVSQSVVIPSISFFRATGAGRSVITPEMFSEAMSEAINRAGPTRNNAGTPMEQSTVGESNLHYIFF